MKMNNNVKPGWLFFLPWSLEAVGGVNRVVTELARAMQQKGDYIPYILISSWEDVSPRVIKREHYTEIYLRIRKPTAEKNTLKALLSFFFYLPFSLWSLHKLLKRYHVRVVNPHYLTSVAFQFFVYRRVMNHGICLITSLHGADLSNGLDEVATIKANKIERLMFRIMLMASDYIVTCSTGLKEKLIARIPSLRNKTVSVPNGYSLDVNKALNIDHKIALPKKSYILSVGTFEHKKGFDVLLNAYADLFSAGLDFDLVLVGRSEPKLAELKQQISDLNLTDSVYIFTDVPPGKMAHFYQSASLFVLASRLEPFGIVLLEAAVNKVPLISTKTMGGCEIIDDGVDGSLVNIDDAEALAKAMGDLLKQPEKMHAYAEAAFKKVSQKYTWKKACHAYCELAKK